MKMQASDKFSYIPTRLGPILALVAVALGMMVATVAWAQPDNPDPDPDPGTHSAPVTTTISISYDEPISAATVTSRTFAVQGMQTGLVTGTHSVQDNAILVTPINPLHPGELVQATATTHTISIAGEHPLAPTVWQFRIAADGGSGRFSYGNTFGTGDDWTPALALGDVDGDGDLDLAVSDYGEQNMVYLNDGDGSFDTTSYVFGTGSDFTSSLALGDMDGDGDLDLVVGNSAGQQSVVYAGNGDGTFGNTPHPFGGSGDWTRVVALGDVDGDGDLDLAVGNFDHQNAIYLNDGDGSFDTTSHAFGTGNDDTFALALGDVDGDGDLDLAVGNYMEQNVVYLNDGDGTFDTIFHTFGPTNDDTFALALGDLDGNGDLDLAVGNTEGHQNAVYTGNGDGTFSNTPYLFGTGSDWTEALALGDVDGDGDLDLVVGNTGDAGAGEQNVVYLNGGDGSFDTISHAFGTGSDWTGDLALGDVDGDGDLDLAVGNTGGEPNLVYRNLMAVTGVTPTPNSHAAAANTTLTITTSGVVSQATVTTRTVFVHGGFHGHLDGTFSFGPSITFDPDEDLHPGEMVEATVTTGVLDDGGLPLSNPYVWQFRAAVDGGSGRFSHGSDFGSGDDWTKEMAMGDVDGDGDLDLAVGNYGEQNAIYLNDDDSAFDTISHTFGTGSDNTYALALGDMDGDGDLDLAVGNWSGQNAVYLNNGDGTFDNTPYPFGPGDSETTALAMGDVDGDGDLDLAVGNVGLEGGQNMVYLNHGDATFPTLPYTFGTGEDQTIALALGDVDRDGDLDLAVGNAYQQNAVYLNDGDGTFDTISHTFGTDLSYTPAVALGDVNGDGSLDLAVGNWGEQNVVHINDDIGNPFDTISHTFGTGADRTGNLVFGDVDGDGDLDLAVGNRGQNAVYIDDGDGTFDTISHTFGLNTDWTSALVTGDVDGDGDLDIAVGNQGEQNAVYLNQVDVCLPLVFKN